MFNMNLTDTHTHLYSEDFAADLDQLLGEARQAGVQRFFLPNIDSSSIESMLVLEVKYPGICLPMMGLHPCSVKENWKEEMSLVEDWLGKRKFHAIGEMGVDLYWDKTFLEEQREVFRRQVVLANDLKLPIVIHSRESFDVIIQLLREVKKESPCGIFHCFSGTVEQAKQVTDLGFYLGIGGVVTYKKSGLDEVLKSISTDFLVLETDAPYLTPVPHRGKRNIPAYLRIIAESVATIKNTTLEEIARITSANSEKIFGI